MCPSAYRASSPASQAGGGGGEGQTGTKTFLGQVGMCVQNFIKTDEVCLAKLHSLKADCQWFFL